jgi:hypothetical protein
MVDQPRPQPPLPFEPALELVTPGSAPEPEREVPLDVFTTLLFDEFSRRTAALADDESRPRV